MTDLEREVIRDFGNEWNTYNQHPLDNTELERLFSNYFKIFPFDKINKNSIGFDMGCGAGRWAKFIAPRVNILNCIEPSELALKVAKSNLKDFKNCNFYNHDVMNNKLKNNSQDFGYSLGVLHHITNPEEGLVNCVKKLKRKAPFLIYLYYRFDNKPFWFSTIWTISNIFRKMISNLPFKLKKYITKIIALFVYLPLARLSLILDLFGLNVKNIPLSYYRNSSFYTMQTDSLDRFGTKIEHRFTKDEIYTMMKNSGLTKIKFSEESPFWVAVGIKN